MLQIHLKNRELENTKLSAELQMLKGVDVNKENTIAQLKDEVGCLRTCLTEKEKQHREVLAKASPSVTPHPPHQYTPTTSHQQTHSTSDILLRRRSDVCWCP